MKSKQVKIDIQHFGEYARGLTENEVKEYLKTRAGATKLGDLYKRFCKIAGPGNTMGLVTCEFCKKEFGVMYRYDVERFANTLFDGTPTFWD
jgi:hypothetical protein